jgi:light-regulated signal transduction histidine kinase (bacteriophytochrome)
MGAPLRNMVEFSRLLNSEETNALSDDGKEYLSLIIDSGEKLQAMMAGLVDYSRLDSVDRTVASVDCNEVLADCRVLLDSKIRDTGAKVEIGPLPTVTADRQQLMQLFVSLLDNALKFHAPGKIPTVSVSAVDREAEWVFTVRDNGIGIDEKFYDRVFQPFKRLHTDREFSGIGMGLTLAKQIVALNGGQLSLVSWPDQGSSFTFTIPVDHGG